MYKAQVTKELHGTVQMYVYSVNDKYGRPVFKGVPRADELAAWSDSITFLYNGPNISLKKGKRVDLENREIRNRSNLWGSDIND